MAAAVPSATSPVLRDHVAAAPPWSCDSMTVFVFPPQHKVQQLSPGHHHCITAARRKRLFLLTPPPQTFRGRRVSGKWARSPQLKETLSSSVQCTLPDLNVCVCLCVFQIWSVRKSLCQMKYNLWGGGGANVAFVGSRIFSIYQKVAQLQSYGSNSTNCPNYRWITQNTSSSPVSTASEQSSI